MGQEKDFIVFGAPLIEEEEIKEVISTMESGWLGTGPKVAQFEKDLREYNGAKFSAAVNSATAAIHLSLVALNLKPGDEVITTPMTFCATVNAIIHSGATPVIADIDPITFNIDPKEIERKITKKTKAIIPVHFAGRPCDMEQLMNLAQEYNLKIVEDCAHAIETEFKGQKTGTFGDFGCFSFYVTKNVVTGEGGMVTAKSQEDIDRIKVLALHGMSKDAYKRFSNEGFKHYQVIEAGFKYNMMDLQAAIGIHQLAKVEKNWLRRQMVWNRYNEAFKELPIEIPAQIELHTRHAYHLYTVLVDEFQAGVSRDEFLNRMTNEGIGVGVHYLSIPEHPFYQETYRWNPDDYPNAKRVGRNIVSLPISAKLTDEEIERVIDSVNRVLSR